MLAGTDNRNKLSSVILLSTITLAQIIAFVKQLIYVLMIAVIY